MPTYQELQATIRDDFLNRGDLGDATKRAIQRAITTYKRRRHWFNEAELSTATTANVSYLSVPSDFFALDRIEVTVGTIRTDLVEKSFDFIRTMNENNATGQPTHFHYRGDRFNLGVTPDDAYPTTIFYLKTLPDLVLDAESNVWTNELFNLIAHHAAYDMLANVVQQADDRKLSHHLLMLKAATTELAEHDVQRLGSRLRSSE